MKRRERIDSWKAYLYERRPTIISLTVVLPAGVMYVAGVVLIKASKAGSYLISRASAMVRWTGLPQYLRNKL